jgi:uncharacterized protein (DUF58 family)
VPTRRGAALLAFAPVLYLFGRATAIGEVIALSAVAVVFPLAAIIYVRVRDIGDVVDRRIEPTRLFSGARLEITYDAAALAEGIALVDPLPQAFGGNVVLETVDSVKRVAGRRGRYDLPQVRATLVDPFGLAWRAKDAGGSDTIVVYPAVEIAHGATPGAREGGGPSMPSRDVTRGDDIAGTRPYVDGDDSRQIHWRTTARTGELMVRRNEARLYPRATVFLDDRAISYASDRSGEGFERAVSHAASAVWSLQRMGTPVALATSVAGPGPARSGAAVTDDLLTALAVVEPAEGPSLLPALRRLGTASGGSLILVAPPGDIPSLVPHLRRLRRRFSFCAALLIDLGSFSHAIASQRMEGERALAEADAALRAAGWRSAYAGSQTRFQDAWTDLVPAASRPA